MTKKKPKVFCLKTASQSEILSLLVFFHASAFFFQQVSRDSTIPFFLIFFYSIRHESSFSRLFVLSHKLSLFFSLGLMGKTKAKYILKLLDLWQFNLIFCDSDNLMIILLMIGIIIHGDLMAHMISTQFLGLSVRASSDHGNVFFLLTIDFGCIASLHFGFWGMTFT